MNSSRVLFRIVLSGAFLWLLGIILAPLFSAIGGIVAGPGRFLYLFYGTICHQVGERSLELLGNPFAVCSRCFAIYSGFLAGGLICMAIGRIPASSLIVRWGAFIALTPMLVDVGFGYTPFYEVTNLTRIVTGAWFGLVISLNLLPAMVAGMVDLLDRWQLQRSFINV